MNRKLSLTLSFIAWLGEVFGGNSSPGASYQLMSMLSHTGVTEIPWCSNPKPDDIKLYLYTRTNSDRPLQLNPTNPSQLSPDKKLVVIIHGWTSSSTAYGLPMLRIAYLKRYDCSVIMVDWSILATQIYPSSVCYLPKIAQILAKFFCLVQQLLHIPLNTVHFVGHSLGGQMSGLIGQNTMAICKSKLGRITAMDPAGPLYQDLPEDQRLDKTDANFVDVIHTNEGVLGYTGGCGHVDFYVNCGASQPGCPDATLDDVMDHPIEASSCDHFRSVMYMAESISSDNFKAKMCKGCPMVCSVDSLGTRTKTIMGERCSMNTSSGGYIVNTNSKPPFATGLLA